MSGDFGLIVAVDMAIGFYVDGRLTGSSGISRDADAGGTEPVSAKGITRNRTRIGMTGYQYTCRAKEMTCKGGKKRMLALIKMMSLVHRGISACSVKYCRSRPR